MSTIAFVITMLIDGNPYAVSAPIPAHFTGNQAKPGALTAYQVRAGFGSGSALMGADGAPDFWVSALQVSLSNRGVNQAARGQKFIDAHSAAILEAETGREARPQTVEKVTFARPQRAAADPTPTVIMPAPVVTHAPEIALPAPAAKVAKEAGLGDVALDLYREQVGKLPASSKVSDYRKLAAQVKNASA